MAYESENEDNLTAANATFSSFMGWLKYGGVAVFIIAAIVVYIMAQLHA